MGVTGRLGKSIDNSNRGEADENPSLLGRPWSIPLPSGACECTLVLGDREAAIGDDRWQE